MVSVYLSFHPLSTPVHSCRGLQPFNIEQVNIDRHTLYSQLSVIYHVHCGILRQQSNPSVQLNLVTEIIYAQRICKIK